MDEMYGWLQEELGETRRSDPGDPSLLPSFLSLHNAFCLLDLAWLGLAPLRVLFGIPKTGALVIQISEPSPPLCSSALCRSGFSGVPTDHESQTLLLEILRLRVQFSLILHPAIPETREVFSPNPLQFPSSPHYSL